MKRSLRFSLVWKLVLTIIFCAAPFAGAADELTVRPDDTVLT